MRWKTCGLAVGAALIGAAAHAQPSTPPVTGEVEELVVVGTRGAARLSTDSASPVDVISGDDLRRRGFSDLTQVLESISPSFNFPPVATSPTSAGSRPATLRGLGADQVLVLVDGKRRHAAATIITNNSVGRGTVPVDFNAIPLASIERIEVLRDGAAAQYGSDAIAGVINIVLRHDSGGGYAATELGETTKGDGGIAVTEGRKGFDLNGKGFLTLSGDLRYHDFTNAAGVDPRFGRVTQRLSSPRTFDVTGAANSEYRLGWATLYGFATVDQRHTESSPIFRVPTTAPAFYPNGFLPRVRQDTTDVGGAVGLKGEVAGWAWDLSDTGGYNRADYDVVKTVNTSLGLASPSGFDGGGAEYLQNIVNLTLDRSFPILAGFHFAVGVEERYEHYALRAGEPASYAGAGAQGFPGINPPSPVSVDRDSGSAFVDGELSLLRDLKLDLAGRYENYSDFGDHVTGKASLFWRPAPPIAFRGAISTGFRAPPLQQQYYSTVTSQLLVPSNVLANVGNFAVTDPVAIAVGATPLKPETSINYSAGVVLTPAPRLSFTADLFRVELKDRIALSENLTGPQVTAILLARGITNAAAVRFFTNAADTLTEGVELTGRWTTPVGESGLLSFTAGYAAFDTDLTGLKQNLVLPNSPLLAATSIAVLVDGQPHNKFTLGTVLEAGPWRVTADIVRFGSYSFPPVGIDQEFGAKTTLDVSVAYALTHALRLQVGVLNAFNTFPDQVIGATDGRIYPDSSGGLDFQGRQVFVRLSASF